MILLFTRKLIWGCIARNINKSPLNEYTKLSLYIYDANKKESEL